MAPPPPLKPLVTSGGALDPRLAVYATPRFSLDDFEEEQLNTLTEKARRHVHSAGPGSPAPHPQLTPPLPCLRQGIRALAAELAQLGDATRAEMERSVFANYSAFIRHVCPCHHTHLLRASPPLLAVRHPGRPRRLLTCRRTCRG